MNICLKIGNRMTLVHNRLKLINIYNVKRKYVTHENESQTTNELRVNALNMQMLSRNLYEQIFKNISTESVSENMVETCLRDLRAHGMKPETATHVPDVELKLPKLEGEDLQEHFRRIGEEQCGPYRNLVNELVGAELPKQPKVWLFTPGWTRYAPDSEPEQVPYPREDAFVFDVEVSIRHGPIPTLATAVSTQAWYGWVSTQLTQNATDKPFVQEHHHYTLDDLIPMESEPNDKFDSNSNSKFNRPKLIVGHNVSYDRARIKEQYWFERSGMRFVDTMSLHVCISGITSYQRAILKSDQKKQNDDEFDPESEDEKWKLYSSLNSLSSVHKLYCGSDLDKQTRDLFVEGFLTDVKENFQDAMMYCARDVNATYNVLRELFPLFLERFPHPVTFAGMLELNMAYLPVNNNWIRYIDEAEQTYEDLNTEAKLLLSRNADNACQLMHNEEYKQDLWMWDQDWSLQELKLKKSNKKLKEIEKPEPDPVPDSDLDPEALRLETKFRKLIDTKYLLPVVKKHLPGYPMWYRKLCSKSNCSDWIPGPHLIGTAMRVTPKLLSLTWEGYPLHFIREKGWGFLVPYSTETEGKKLPMKKLLETCPVLVEKSINEQNLEIGKNFQSDLDKNLTQTEFWRSKTKRKNDKTEGFYKGTGVWSNLDLEDCCWFMKLPHKNGVSFNVGNPLARDFLNKFSDNVLAGSSESAERVLSIARMLSYWKNNRNRIQQQIVVWLKETEVPRVSRSENFQYGAIIPQIVTCGTLTRRAMEPTWMTASNAHAERVGSELRTLVQAPVGYAIVGADVDSQELWIASTIGDAAYAQMHGATPLGWMTLIGTKSNGTDMHSVTAKAIGISRDHAKIINYARIYGAGQNFAEQLLKQFNPTMSQTEAKSKAQKMFTLTKGKRMYRLKTEFCTEYMSDKKLYNSYQAFELTKAHGKRVEEMFEKPKWIGGSESAMFNRLEEIAYSPKPVTPFLQCRLSRALESADDENRFLPTRVNWVVQSGAVDFLHLMLVSMRWLMKDRIRFCLSFHDEVRYLVAARLRYDAALAMHITNLLTRSFCSMQLGVSDLPQSVAFFSSVEVDSVVRKDSQVDCKTPSNPHGLLKGYGIENGESLTVEECIRRTGGRICLNRK